MPWLSAVGGWCWLQSPRPLVKEYPSMCLLMTMMMMMIMMMAGAERREGDHFRPEGSPQGPRGAVRKGGDARGCIIARPGAVSRFDSIRFNSIRFREMVCLFLYGYMSLSVQVGQHTRGLCERVARCFLLRQIDRDIYICNKQTRCAPSYSKALVYHS